jgi:UDP-arabinose 4-epimerase
MISRTVAVLGGAGYVGSHAAKALAEAGHVPLVIDNLSAGRRSAVRYGPFGQADIRDTARLANLLRQHGASAVLHFAASIEVGIGEREPLAFHDNNVAGTISVLKAMQQAGVEVLVFSSTCAVYGPAPQPLTEQTPRAPASVYGRTKAMVEQVIEDVCRTGALRAVLLRYFNASGADASGEIGETHDPETHLIPNALKAAVGLGPELKVFGTDYDTPDGTCLRDYVHVSDLADAHVAALALAMEAGPGLVEAVNLGTGQPCSVREVMAAAARVTGRPVPHALAPRRAGDVPVLTADIAKARRLLGFQPRFTQIDAIVASAFAFHEVDWGLKPPLTAPQDPAG